MDDFIIKLNKDSDNDWVIDVFNKNNENIYHTFTFRFFPFAKRLTLFKAKHSIKKYKKRKRNNESLPKEYRFINCRITDKF